MKRSHKVCQAWPGLITSVRGIWEVVISHSALTYYVANTGRNCARGNLRAILCTTSFFLVFFHSFDRVH